MLFQPEQSEGRGGVRAISTADRISISIAAAAALVVALGIGREVFVELAGDQTFLQEARHFNLGGEQNLPSWFSAVLMLLVAALAAAIAHQSKLSQPGIRLRWGGLSFVFVLLSLDEIASFHEATMEPIRNATGADGIFHYAWLIVAIPLVVGFAILNLPLLRCLPRAIAARILLAGMIYVAGAVGLEMLGGVIASSSGEGTIPARLAYVAEEVLEISGLTLLATTLVAYASLLGLRLARDPP